MPVTWLSCDWGRDCHVTVRLSAVYGGVYCLQRHVSSIVTSSGDNTVSSVVCSSGQKIKCSWEKFNSFRASVDGYRLVQVSCSVLCFLLTNDGFQRQYQVSHSATPLATHTHTHVRTALFSVWCSILCTEQRESPEGYLSLTHHCLAQMARFVFCSLREKNLVVQQFREGGNEGMRERYLVVDTVKVAKWL